MAIEIERRFFFDTLPEEAPKTILDMEQAYLNRKPVLRIRKKEALSQNGEAFTPAAYECTYKGKKTGAIGKEEVNLPLNEKAYLHLREKADGILIRKKRHVYALPDGFFAEADVFEGDYAGLKIVEVEFDSEEAAQAFTPPQWFGEEITGRKEFSNASLAYNTPSAGGEGMI